VKLFFQEKKKVTVLTKNLCTLNYLASFKNAPKKKPTTNTQKIYAFHPYEKTEGLGTTF